MAVRTTGYFGNIFKFKVYIPLCGTGNEDVNDTECLSVDPVMRAITGKKDKGKQAASTITISYSLIRKYCKKNQRKSVSGLHVFEQIT